ncbi:MAG: ribonuclease D [Candidatus Woesearchaeota archaeon]
MVVYVDTKEALLSCCEELQKEAILGVDLECENNLHHYGVYISILQISSKHKDWIIDMLALDSLGPLKDVLESKDIQKIFHDVSFDFRILNYQYACKPQNIFDTEIAALLIGEEHIGLGPLLEKYFSVNKKEVFQMADWTKRPLTKEMLLYATKDSRYLIELRDLLLKKLEDLDRVAWAEQEFEHITSIDWIHTNPEFETLRGLHVLSEKELGLAKALYDFREMLAKKSNRPVHYIFNTKRLLEFAKNPPQDWSDIKGVHPIVKRYAKDLKKLCEGSYTYTIPIPEKKRFSKEERRRMQELSEAKDRISKKIGLASYLVANKEQSIQFVLQNNFSMFRPWQKKLLEAELVK